MSRQLVGLICIVTLAASCGSTPREVTTDPALTESTVTTVMIEPVATTPATASRLVVLGEDFLLSDVLALGITPVAASATLDEFTGIEGDTSGITPLVAADLNLEALEAQQPTQIIATRFVADQVGEELLSGIAPTVVLDDTDWREQFTQLADALGEADRGAAMLDVYDNAVAVGQVELAGLQVSLASVYPGPSNVEAASNGRAFLAEERLEDLASEVIVLSQSNAVEGESEALDQIRSGGLWQSLPAVMASRVVIVDRLGYAGLSGRTRLVETLVSSLIDS